MTETEWLACQDPARLLFEFGFCVNQRKMRLLFTAHCRRAWSRLAEVCRHAVNTAEEFVDGPGAVERFAALHMETMEEASHRGIISAHVDVGEVEYDEETRAISYPDFTPEREHELAELRANTAAAAFAAAAVQPTYRSGDSFFWGLVPNERLTDANNIRDIFGNPFRPGTFSSSWRTSTTVTLASQMYESRNFSAMPILADALQDAGCDDEDILNHCRGHGPHVRGCWVVDLLLGKS